MQHNNSLVDTHLPNHHELFEVMASKRHRSGNYGSDTSQSESEASIDQEVEAWRQLQQMQKIEKALRLRQSITTMEKDQIQALMKDGNKLEEGEAELALLLWGQKRGRAVTTVCYQAVLGEDPFPFTIWPVGSPSGQLTVAFSMAKSLLLSARQIHRDTPSAAGAEERKCFCFPKTALMPRGCAHHPCQFGVPPDPCKSIPFICAICAVCMRCHRSLGYDINMMQA